MLKEINFFSKLESYIWKNYKIKYRKNITEKLTEYTFLY